MSLSSESPQLQFELFRLFFGLTHFPKFRFQLYVTLGLNSKFGKWNVDGDHKKFAPDYVVLNHSPRKLEKGGSIVFCDEIVRTPYSQFVSAASPLAQCLVQ